MRIRIKFAKKDTVKYLGHLDILRFFQRCFNRADVRMEYSIGFNPHQKMSFAQPLGVGITSCGEYLDAEIADGQDLTEIRRRLNDVCGNGFEVLSVRALPEDAKKAMASVRFAEYNVDVTSLLDEGGANTQEQSSRIQKAVEEILKEDTIPVMKRTKSGEHEVDIRPQILKLKMEDGQIRMTVTAASDNNLKAETLVKEVFSRTDIEYMREKITINRNELYAEKMTPLEEFQTIE